MPSPVLSPIVGFTEIDPNVMMPTQQANQALLDLEQATLGELDVAMADANQALTADQLKHWTFVCSGALTADRNLIVPVTKRPFDVLNNTTGGHNVTVKTPSGTGISIAPGSERIVRADGTNVVAVSADANNPRESLPVVASETIANGALVNLWNNAGTLNVRNANATDNTKPADGFVLTGGSSSATLTVYFAGLDSSQSGLTAGTIYYLDTSPGAVTATAPSSAGNLVQRVGRAVSTTALLFQFAPGVTL